MSASRPSDVVIRHYNVLDWCCSMLNRKLKFRRNTCGCCMLYVGSCFESVCDFDEAFAITELQKRLQKYGLQSRTSVIVNKA